MATDTKPATAPALSLYRLTTRQFEAMCVAGVFPEGAHVELLGGRLVDKMTKHPPHVITLGATDDAVRRLLLPGWFVNVEQPIRLGRFWRPEPDLAVVRGRRHDYPKMPPGASDLALLVEVSDTTYAKDRGVKWRRYAAARVGIYWIVNLATKAVEVYTDPAGRGKSAAYRQCQVYGIDAEVPVVIDGREVGRIAVKDILP